MRRYTLLVAILCVMAGTGARAAEAQDAAEKAAATKNPLETAAAEQRRALLKENDDRNIASLNNKTPLQVQVVVSRYLGEKRISALPFVLAVNAVGPTISLGMAESAQLQMGSTVPVGGSGIGRFERVGTVIESGARAMGDGRYELRVSVDDNSLTNESREGKAAGESAVEIMRNFQARQILILRDGQSRQFTAATDRVSGEVVRIDVTLTVMK